MDSVIATVKDLPQIIAHTWFAESSEQFIFKGCLCKMQQLSFEVHFRTKILHFALIFDFGVFKIKITFALSAHAV
jgi:hypothetical protein